MLDTYEGTTPILDNSRYHHAILLKPWLEKHQEEIQLDFLPPYSPKLNPIERVWKLTRRLCTHNPLKSKVVSWYSNKL